MSQQLRPLSERLGEGATVRREERMSRRAVRALAIEHGHLKGGIQHFFGRGLFGRLKWLLTGR